MSIHAEIAADAAQIFTEFGKEIILASKRLKGLVSEPQETLELEAGGFTASGNFTVKLLRSDLPQIPQIGETLDFSGEGFRIVRISNRPPHPMITLTVEPLE
jgi:hypothetical protein